MKLNFQFKQLMLICCASLGVVPLAGASQDSCRLRPTFGSLEESVATAPSARSSLRIRFLENETLELRALESWIEPYLQPKFDRFALAVQKSLREGERLGIDDLVLAHHTAINSWDKDPLVAQVLEAIWSGDGAGKITRAWSQDERRLLEKMFPDARGIWDAPGGIPEGKRLAFLNHNPYRNELFLVDSKLLDVLQQKQQSLAQFVVGLDREMSSGAWALSPRDLIYSLRVIRLMPADPTGLDMALEALVKGLKKPVTPAERVLIVDLASQEVVKFRLRKALGAPSTK